MKNKNRFKLFGLAILVTAIVFNFTVCSGGGAGGGGAPTPVVPAEPTSAVFESRDNDNNIYVLKITKATSGSKAVYNPKDGDNYVLTITKDSSIKRSSGTITTVNNNNLTLKPTDSTTSFTVTIEKTSTAALLTQISGTIVTDKGEVTGPDNMTPVGTFETFALGADWWVTENSAETWRAKIKLSDFTTKKPKAGDVFIFGLSGNPDKPINWFNISIEGGKWNNEDSKYEYKWFGGSEGSEGGRRKFSSTSENIFKITISDEVGDYDSSLNIDVTLTNWLWFKRDNNSDDYEFNSGETLPAGTPFGKTMATIKNFKIWLIEEKD